MVEGGHSGKFRGKRYFTCEDGHGLMLPLAKLQLDDRFDQEAATRAGDDVERELKMPSNPILPPAPHKMSDPLPPAPRKMSDPLSPDLPKVAAGSSLENDILSTTLAHSGDENGKLIPTHNCSNSYSTFDV